MGLIVFPLPLGWKDGEEGSPGMNDVGVVDDFPFDLPPL
jgi:hypothetical protein